MIDEFCEQQLSDNASTQHSMCTENKMLTKIAKNCRAVAITCKSSTTATVGILKKHVYCINITSISANRDKRQNKEMQ